MRPPFGILPAGKLRLPKEARKVLHAARQAPLTSKQRRLLEEVAEAEDGVCEDDMTRSQRDVAAQLKQLGYLETHSGSWTGLPYYYVKGARR